MNHSPNTQDSPSDDELEVRERIADLVAGDLDESSARQLRALLRDDPQLQQEQAFWEQVYDVLPDAAHPHTVPVPGPGMARILRAQLAAEESSIRTPMDPVAPRGWWSWTVPWTVAAAAVIGLLLVLMSPQDQASDRQQRVMVYDEYGEAFAVPSWEVEAVEHRHASAEHEAPQAWMGLLTRPIELRGFAQDRGLEIVRLAAGSPAAEAGLQPRDVIVSIDDMSTATRWCLPNALRDHQPDEQVVVTYWRAGKEGLHSTAITLGQRNERR
ncbi:MAG: PDZ domain-containing protein [Planctomycetota bacterium]|nr:MAG: PDZ domain-containing protein [Planctomycetota bacterium]